MASKLRGEAYDGVSVQLFDCGGCATLPDFLKLLLCHTTAGQEHQQQYGACGRANVTAFKKDVQSVVTMQ